MNITAHESVKTKLIEIEDRNGTLSSTQVIWNMIDRNIDMVGYGAGM